jgi:hypothetical protein
VPNLPVKKLPTTPSEEKLPATPSEVKLPAVTQSLPVTPTVQAPVWKKMGGKLNVVCKL